MQLDVFENLDIHETQKVFENYSLEESRKMITDNKLLPVESVEMVLIASVRVSTPLQQLPYAWHRVGAHPQMKRSLSLLI